MAATATSFALPTPPPTLSQPDGESVGWKDWIGVHGSTVVVVWASWLPDEQKDLSTLKNIRRAAENLDMDFVVIALQEPITESRDALNGSGLPWLHDRHGTILKHLLVFTVPSLVVVRGDGTVLERLPADSDSLVQWSGSK